MQQSAFQPSCLRCQLASCQWLENTAMLWLLLLSDLYKGAELTRHDPTTQHEAISDKAPSLHPAVAAVWQQHGSFRSCAASSIPALA